VHMSGPQIISYVITAFFLPLLVGFLKNQTWSDEAKFLFAQVMNAIAWAVLTFIFAPIPITEHGWREIVAGYAVVAITSTASFKLVWNNISSYKQLEAAKVL
jgi:uncharacterized membrane protein YhdT